MYHLTEPIHECHYCRVPFLCHRQTRNQIHRDRLPRSCRYRQRLQQASRLLRRNLRRLTHLTSLHIVSYGSTHTRPKIPTRQTTYHSIHTKVASHWRFVMRCNQLLLQLLTRNQECAALPPPFTKQALMPNILRTRTTDRSFGRDEPLINTLLLSCTDRRKRVIRQRRNNSMKL